MDSVIIRSEQVKDYPSIAAVNAIAFTYSLGMGEVSLISLLRNRESFDPDLSLVAESQGRVIGHILFTPLRLSINGETADAVLLAPVAVLPEFHKQGVGVRLIEEGHKRAAEKRYQLSFLIGHPSYYPRFGYIGNRFGTHQVTIQLDDIPELEQSVDERRIAQEDIGKFHAMWETWYREAPLAVKPGASITDWISPGTDIQASAVMIEGELCGYIRYKKHNPIKVTAILSKDAESLVRMCSYLKTKINSKPGQCLTLPLPASSYELSKINVPYVTEIQTGPERMIHVLAGNNRTVADYCREVDAGQGKPGHVVWPVEFDVC